MAAPKISSSDTVADYPTVQNALADEVDGKATTAEVTAAINSAVSDLLDGAPGALDTLNELAAALGDDADFAATVAASLADKAALSTALYTVREVDGTYQARPSVADVPNAEWIGESDPTADPDFVEWNATTGAGDVWREVPSSA